MSDPLGRFHRVWQGGQLGQASQGTRLGDTRHGAEVLVGTLLSLVVQNEF